MKKDKTPIITVDAKFNRLRFNPEANKLITDAGTTAGRVKLLFDLAGKNAEARLNRFVNKPHQEANGGLVIRSVKMFKEVVLPNYIATIGDQVKYMVADVTALDVDPLGDVLLLTLKPYTNAAN